MKSLLKQLTHGLAVLLLAPLWLLWRFVLHGNDGTFAAISQLLSVVPGKTGSYLRIGFYRLAMKNCSADCFIGFGTLFSQADTNIGDGAYIGPQCNIGRCHIGKDTLIASGVHITSGTSQHQFEQLHTPIRDQGGRFEKIRIGEDCWIGNAALIMANVGDHCVIGAGSVVVTDVPDYAIAVGNPARVIRSRKDATPQAPITN